MIHFCKNFSKGLNWTKYLTLNNNKSNSDNKDCKDPKRFKNKEIK